MSQRFVGIKNGRIKIISNKTFAHSEYQVLELPPELQQTANEELILNYRVRDNQFVARKGSRPAKELKVAFIGNYQQACGISTYNSHLFPQIVPHIKDFQLFNEINDVPVGELTLDKNKIVACWQRGKSVDQLIKEVKKYDPDVVLISHEFGLFPNARHWLSLMTQLSDYRIIVILHSTFPEHLDKIIVEASIPEIVVHSNGAKQSLHTDKHIHTSVNVIPHGCYSLSDASKLWNFYHSKHTFIQSGFSFPYKNMTASIKAAALLKDKYPDIFLTLLVSESPFNKVGHQIYYEQLIDLIEQLEVQNNVGIVRGFLSEEVIDAYYRTNKVAVFPYASQPGHEVWGASGAIRQAASKQVPVISSNIHHFSDFPSIKVDTEQELADALDQLFNDPKLQQAQVAKQNQFITDNSWENVALRFIKLFEGDLTT